MVAKQHHLSMKLHLLVRVLAIVAEHVLKGVWGAEEIVLAIVSEVFSSCHNKPVKVLYKEVKA